MPEPEGESAEHDLPDLPDLDNEQGNLLKGIDNCSGSVVQGTWSPLDNSFDYVHQILIRREFKKIIIKKLCAIIKSYTSCFIRKKKDFFILLHF